jgi:hypothetical protein
MSTNPPDALWAPTLRTLLLGLVLALGIALAAREPSAAWLGFVLAATAGPSARCDRGRGRRAASRGA